MAAHRYWRILVTGSNWVVVSIGELSFFDATGTRILGGTPSASSTYSGCPAANAFDGNFSTFWASNGNPNTSPEWLEYDFGSPQDLAWVTLVGRDLWLQSPTAFSFQYSDDDSTWTDLGAHTTSWGADKPSIQAFLITAPPAGEYLWWRIHVTSTNSITSPTTTGVSIAELVWYSSGTALPVNSAVTPTSAGQSFADNVFYPLNPADAYDGNLTTWWGSASSVPVSLGYVFPKPWAIDYVSIANRGDSLWTDQSPADFCIEASNDGSAWTTIKCFSGVPWTGPAQSQLFNVGAAGGGGGVRVYGSIQ